MYTFCFTFFAVEVLWYAGASVSDGQLSDFMATIWNGDTNAATSVRVNLQGHTYSGSTSDRASSSLFSYVNDYYYFSRPTYAALIRLLDNYNHVVGGAEHSNYEEDHEVTSFLDAISKTSVMQKTLQFLHQHGYVGSTWSSLETQLRRIWFDGYPRHGHVTDSSGFEHVFVGETDSTEVVGFHNWIQFHLQEKKGNLDYMGYIFSKQPNILGAHFRWLSKTKSLGSLMYGTSPEFDIAMYTVCFFARTNHKCNFSVNGHNIQVQTYDINHGGGIHLGTAHL
ncbi:uridylate-specific endoribonuclease D-like [Mercenaria mercenaria]|uniref:uridylate-specific endoribonuclease D-like n=1 Tax=Mercenaria mercenaria TaxID=6596 RepID=UPI00234EE076|nr:uridylate-specific endoribonuclease D-like [Mercenaria mercenaria]